VKWNEGKVMVECAWGNVSATVHDIAYFITVIVYSASILY
jgi:hypothetical protein